MSKWLRLALATCLFCFCSTARSFGQVTSNTVTFTVIFPPPVISTISPTVTTAGGPAFTLTVNGTGFVSGDTVLWCEVTPTLCTTATSLVTTFVSATQLTAAVPATAIAVSGTFQVSVTRTTTHAVLLMWNPSTTANVTYSVYKSSVAGGPYSPQAKGLTGATYDTGPIPAGTYYYAVTAVDASGVESFFSNEAKAVVPA